MKSTVGNRETVGSSLAKTQKEHMSSKPVEAAELAHEGGKSYMRELINTVEKHLHVKEPYYIQVIGTKLPYSLDRAVYFRFFARRTEPLMEPDMDVWRVNNAIEELKLMWSLPKYDEFDAFLANRHKFDKHLIHWIETYKKQLAAGVAKRPR